MCACQNNILLYMFNTVKGRENLTHNTFWHQLYFLASERTSENPYIHALEKQGF